MVGKVPRVDDVEKVSTLERAYELFNERRIDQLLAMMVDDVQWPDVANGAVLEGPSAIRQYWGAQFATVRSWCRLSSYRRATTSSLWSTNASSTLTDHW